MNCFFKFREIRFCKVVEEDMVVCKGFIVFFVKGGKFLLVVFVLEVFMRLLEVVLLFFNCFVFVLICGRYLGSSL